MYGKILKYFPDRGYGFISGDDGNRYFIHNSKLNGEYVERGYYVYFTPFRNSRSEYNAKNISVIEVPEGNDLRGNKRNRNTGKHKSCNADRVMEDNKRFNGFMKKFTAEQKNRQQEEKGLYEKN